MSLSRLLLFFTFGFIAFTAIGLAQTTVVTDEELALIWRLPDVEQVRAFSRLAPARKEYVSNKIRSFESDKPWPSGYSEKLMMRALIVMGDKATLEFARSCMELKKFRPELAGTLMESRAPEAFAILAKGLNLNDEWGAGPNPSISSHSFSSMEYLGENNDFLPKEVKEWFKTLKEDANRIGDHRDKILDTEALGKLSESLKLKYPLCIGSFPWMIVDTRARDIVREWWKENAAHIEANVFASVRPGKRIMAFEGVLAPYANVWRDVELAHAELTGKPPIFLGTVSPENSAETVSTTTGAQSTSSGTGSSPPEESPVKSNSVLPMVGIAALALGGSVFLWRKRRHQMGERGETGSGDMKADK